MAPTLTAKISVAVQVEYRNPLDLSAAVDNLDFQKVLRLGSGVAAGQADRCWHSRRILAASATENLDLSGTLTDEYGNPLTPARIKGLYVRAADANTNDVVVGGAGTNAWTGPFGGTAHTLAVPPGMLLPLTRLDGWPVTANTADLLKFANGGAGSPVTYDVVIFATSA